VIVRLLRRPAFRFALLCLAVSPLAGCAGISMSCGSSRSTESGTVVVTGAPAAAERGATIRLDLTGTKLVGGNEDKDRCITHITTYWSDAWEANQSFTVPADKRCQPLAGFTIDVKVPTNKQVSEWGTSVVTGTPTKGDAYVGGTLTIQANGFREEVTAADGVTWVGNRLVAVKALTITVPPAANAAPTADLFARYAPMPAAGLTTDAGSDYGPLGAAIDARMSSDPEAEALTYAWDLDGDGVYGDAPDGGTGVTGLPAGVAIVPASRRAVGTGTGSTWAAVQVTDPGGLTATKRLDLTVSGSMVGVPKISGLSPTTATTGSTVTLTFATTGSDFACIDPDGANPLSPAGQRHSIQTSGTTFPITAGAVGNHRVTVSLWFGADPASCAAAGLAAPAFTWSDIYTAAAPKRATAVYRARVNLTTTKAVPIASSVSDLGILTDVIGRGRYALSAPAKARGVARPTALGLFRRGDFVASAPAVDFLGAGANETPIATSTMLLRGTGGVLACVRAQSTASGLSYSFLGGTGAARRIVADAIATPAKVTPPAKPPKTVKPQRRPVRGNAQMAASTGSARALPAACRALIRHLP